MKVSAPAAILVVGSLLSTVGIVYITHGRRTPTDEIIEFNSPLFVDDDDESGQFDSASAQPNVLPRIEKKQQVARALIRGEITFAVAAERFRVLSQDEPASLGYLRSKFPLATEAELWFRQVIGYVKGFYRSDPERVAALLPLLEAEVAQRFPRKVALAAPVQPDSSRTAKPLPPRDHLTVSPGGRLGSQGRPRYR